MSERLPKPLRVTEFGRATIAAAVAIDHDWALHSSFDTLIESLGQLSDDDLEAAYLLAYHLREAVAVLQIRRDRAKREARGEQ